jgi:hypothetical protein
MVQSVATVRGGLARVALLGALAFGAVALAPASADAHDYRYYRPAPVVRPYYAPPYSHYAVPVYPRPYYRHWQRHHYRYWDQGRGWDGRR